MVDIWCVSMICGKVYVFFLRNSFTQHFLKKVISS